MELYIVKINEQGSLIVTTESPKRSNRLGITRSGGQRFQVPSVLRASKDIEAQHALQLFIDDLSSKFNTGEVVSIDWAVPTDNPVTMNVDGATVELKTKWADLDLDALEAAVEPFFDEIVKPAKAAKPSRATQK